MDGRRNNPDGHNASAEFAYLSDPKLSRGYPDDPVTSSKRFQSYADRQIMPSRKNTCDLMSGC